MKSQDIVLLLKLISLENSAATHVREDYSLRRLENLTGISKSELSSALNRCIDVGLATKDRHNGAPRANRKALLGFISKGLRYVFPAKPGPLARGVPTAFATPALAGQLMSAGETIYVWPDATGTEKGQSITPLFKTVPHAAKQDADLYLLLALVDAIRLGNPREAKFAEQQLSTAFKL